VTKNEITSTCCDLRGRVPGPWRADLPELLAIDELERLALIGLAVRDALPFVATAESKYQLANAGQMHAGAVLLEDYEDTEGPCDVLRAIATHICHEVAGAEIERALAEAGR
jgi:hypothetical protein